MQVFLKVYANIHLIMSNKKQWCIVFLNLVLLLKILFVEHLSRLVFYTAHLGNSGLILSIGTFHKVHRFRVQKSKILSGSHTKYVESLKSWKCEIHISFKQSCFVVFLSFPPLKLTYFRFSHSLSWFNIHFSAL